MNEKNKLIAKFVGFTVYEDGWCGFLDTKNVHIDKLKFDSSWDYLMPVIEKIQDTPAPASILTFNKKPFSVVIKDECCEVLIDNGADPNQDVKFNYHHKGTFIENVYNSVLEFVEWYQKTTLIITTFP